MVSKEYVRTRKLEDINEKNDVVRVLSDKLKAFVRKVQASEGPDPFFHRKSNRVVLSVLQCKMDDEDYWFEGINGEVSLPTGSLCSERAAIAHARAKFPQLRRENMKAIAVVEIPFGVDKETADNPLWPCGACMEWLKKIQEETANFRVLAYNSVEMTIVFERYLFLSHAVQDVILDVKDLEGWQCRACGSLNKGMTSHCSDCQGDRLTSKALATFPVAIKNKNRTKKTVKKILKSLDKEIESQKQSGSYDSSLGIARATWKRSCQWFPGNIDPTIAALHRQGYVRGIHWNLMGASDELLCDGYEMTEIGQSLKQGATTLKDDDPFFSTRIEVGNLLKKKRTAKTSEGGEASVCANSQPLSCKSNGDSISDLPAADIISREFSHEF